MDPTFAMLIILPMAVGCLLPIVSVICIWKTGPIVPWLIQWIGLALIVPAIVASEWMLWAIVRGAWPSSLPHLFILVAVMVVYGQIFLAVKTARRPVAVPHQS